MTPEQEHQRLIAFLFQVAEALGVKEEFPSGLAEDRILQAIEDLKEKK